MSPKITYSRDGDFFEFAFFEIYCDVMSSNLACHVDRLKTAIFVPPYDFYDPVDDILESAAHLCRVHLDAQFYPEYPRTVAIETCPVSADHMFRAAVELPGVVPYVGDSVEEQREERFPPVVSASIDDYSLMFVREDFTTQLVGIADPHAVTYLDQLGKKILENPKHPLRDRVAVTPKIHQVLFTGRLCPRRWEADQTLYCKKCGEGIIYCRTCGQVFLRCSICGEVGAIGEGAIAVPEHPYAYTKTPGKPGRTPIYDGSTWDLSRLASCGTSDCSGLASASIVRRLVELQAGPVLATPVLVSKEGCNPLQTQRLTIESEIGRQIYESTPPLRD